MRYYLKCKKCSYLTEIIGNNISYCINCTHKFDDNFKDWQVKSNRNDIQGYKNEVCLSFPSDEADKLVQIHNKKHTKTNLTKEEKLRRTYIKEGYPLDRGGFTEWTWKQIVISKIWYVVIIGGLILLLYLLGKIEL